MKCLNRESRFYLALIQRRTGLEGCQNQAVEESEIE